LIRLRLFGFFAMMAVASLFRPRVGKELIDLAQQADDDRARRRHVEAVMGNAQRVRR